MRGQSGWRVGPAHTPHITTGLYNCFWLFVLYIVYFAYRHYLFYFTLLYLFNLNYLFPTAFNSIFFLHFFSLTGPLAFISRTWNLGDALENLFNQSDWWWQPLLLAKLASPPLMVSRFQGTLTMGISNFIRKIRRLTWLLESRNFELKTSQRRHLKVYKIILTTWQSIRGIILCI